MKKLICFIFLTLILASACGPGKAAEERFRLAVAEADTAYFNSDTLPDLSALNEVIDYYHLKEKSPIRQRAYYLRGYQHHLRGNYTDAIIDYLNAEQSAKAIHDTTALGLTYRAIADTYTELCDYASALSYYKKSLDAFELGKSEKYEPYARIDLAKSYFQNDKFNLCDSILQSFLNELPDSNLLPAIYRTLGKSKFEQKKYEQSLLYFRQLKDLGTYRFYPLDYEYLGNSYLLTDNIDSARYYRDFLLNIDFNPEWLSYLIAKRENDFKGMSSELNALYRTNNDWLNRLSSSNYSHIIESNYEILTELSNQKEKFYRSYIIIILLSSLLILTFVFILSDRQKKKMKQEIEQNVMALTGVQLLLKDLTKQTTVATQLSGNMLSEYISIFDNILRTYYQYHDNKKQTGKISEEIKSALHKFQKDSAFIQEVEKAINLQKSNVLIRLREQNPQLTEQEMYLYLLIILGFSTSAICALLNFDSSQVHSRKGHLKRKLKSNCSPDLEEFLSFL